MKKGILKLGILVLTFVIGTAAVWLLSFNVQRQNYETFVIKNSSCRKDLPKKQKDGVEVKFLNFVENKDNLTVRFEITNNSGNTYLYSALKGTANTESIVSPEFKLSGKKIEQGSCGFGLETFELKPGEIRSFEVYSLSYFWKKGQHMQVGVELRENNKPLSDSRIYWSEDLPITKNIARKLLAEQKVNR